MRHTLVRYTVKPEQAARNEELVRQVYAELQQTAPPDLHYATFVMDDGVSFVHVASTEREDGPSPLQEVAAFRAFTENVAERCNEQPVAVSLRQIGAYRFAGG